MAANTCNTYGFYRTIRSSVASILGLPADRNSTQVVELQGREHRESCGVRPFDITSGLSKHAYARVELARIPRRLSLLLTTQAMYNQSEKSPSNAAGPILVGACRNPPPPTLDAGLHAF